VTNGEATARPTLNEQQADVRSASRVVSLGAVLMVPIWFNDVRTLATTKASTAPAAPVPRR
jgi:hypothetical protein